MTSHHPGSLLRDLDLDKTRFLDLVALARRLKDEKHHGTELPRLHGVNLALVFEQNSTRTRCAFDVAAHDQGAQVTYLGPEGSHIGREESIADTARVLYRMFDGIAFRGYRHQTVEPDAHTMRIGVRWHTGATDELAVARPGPGRTRR